MKTLISILTIILFLTSCGDDSSGGGSGIIAGTFEDSAVSNFSQTSNIAHFKKGIPQQTIELIIPSAYAGGGSISCLSGDSISFQMDAFSNTITVNTNCSSANAIDLNIRQGLLESMDGISIKRTKTDASFANGAIDLTSGGDSGGFNWDDENVGTTNDLYVVKAMDDCDGSGGDLYEVYSFNQSTGKVTLYTLMDSGTIPTALSKSSAATCAAVTGGTDANSDGLEDDPAIASFRFKDGSMELDLSGSSIFEESRGSVNGDGTTICNNATIPASNTCESFYEKWEQCTIGVDCVL